MDFESDSSCGNIVYTFHGLSYVIDIYKDRIKAEKNFIDYSVFVSFFPLLVAGPIERATHLLPQIHVDVLFLFGKENDVFDFDLTFYYLDANERKRWWDLCNYKKLASFIKQGQYYIVQANAGDTLKYASLSKKIFSWNAKLVFRNANKISFFLTSNVKKKLNAWLMKEVDYVASVSDECTEDFKKMFPNFKDQIASLPIGVNLQTHTLQFASGNWN